MSKKINFFNSIINIQTPFLFIALMLVSVPFAYAMGISALKLGCEYIPLLGNTGICLNNDPYNDYYFFLELIFAGLPVLILFGYLWYGILKELNKYAKKPFKKMTEKKNKTMPNPGLLGVLVIALIPLSMQIAYYIDKKYMIFGIQPSFFPVTIIDFIAMTPIWIFLTYICFLFIKYIPKWLKK